MQQLQVFGKEFDALNKLNVETVAIGTDDLEASKVLKNNKDGIKFPMPILPDPKHEIFKLYQAFDDFDGQPLHGTVLIDGQGKVRFSVFRLSRFLMLSSSRPKRPGRARSWRNRRIEQGGSDV